MRSAGLTFIELLIVLVVIGAGWFALVPRLDLASRNQEGPLGEVNALLIRAGHQAVWSGVRQGISVHLGHKVVEWGGETAELPEAVSRITRNSRHVYGSETTFFIYSTGHMDELSLWLTSGEHLRAQPLARSLETVSH